jgi:prefoldin subunit 5
MEYRVLPDGTIEEKGEQPIRILTIDEISNEINVCSDHVVSLQSEITRIQSEIERLQGKIEQLTSIKKDAEKIINNN